MGTPFIGRGPHIYIDLGTPQIYVYSFGDPKIGGPHIPMTAGRLTAVAPGHTSTCGNVITARQEEGGTEAHGDKQKAQNHHFLCTVGTELMPESLAVRYSAIIISCDRVGTPI